MTREFERPVVIRLIWAFVIATGIFIIIFVIANSVSYLNYQYIVNQNNVIEEAIGVLEDYPEFDICEDSSLFLASEQLDIVGNRMSLLEQRFGKNDPRVLEQKKLYSLLEFRHFELVKEFSNKCPQNYTTIVFFYSNIDGKQIASETISYMLSLYKEQGNESVMVYSYDYDLDSELIEELKEKYGFDFAPKISINEGEPFYPKNIQDLENY
jgi:hypothetical protein